MRHRHAAIAVLLVCTGQAAAKTPLPVAPPNAGTTMDQQRPLTNTIYRTAPFPGTTLVRTTLWSYDRKSTRQYCFFLVKGDPQTVMASGVQPGDILQMSCTQHYVRTTKNYGSYEN